MITFLDHNDTEYGTLTSITVGNGVNGERTISGTIVEGEHVIHNIDLGWRLRFEDEYYAVVFAEPIDLGNRIEVQFDAVHQFFYDFSKSVVHRRLDGSNTMQNYLNFIFSGSGYSFSLETTIGAFPKENFGYKSRLSLFNDIMSSIDAEFVVHGRVVRILSRVGTDLTTIVKKGFNLNEIRLEKNIGNFITRKKGYGAYFDEENQSAGRLEVEYISPLEEIYGVREGDPVLDERYTVADNLLSRLQKEVDSSYDISVQIDMEDLTKAGYEYDQPRAGDYITAINDDLGFRRSVRIVSFKSEYDIQGQLIKHDIECNSLGQVKKEGNEYTRLEKEFNDKLAEAEDKFLSLVSANGRNRNYYGTEFPLDEPKGTLVVGDQLWLQVGEVVKRYYWNGEEWIIDPFSEDSEWVKKEVERVAEEAEKLADDITEAQQSADDAKRDAGLALTASEALEIITQETASQLSDTRGLLATVESNASEAWAKADSALSQAGQAVNTADTAKTNAQTALTNAQTALTEAGNAKTTANNLSIKVDEVEAEVELKASQSAVDGLRGTVSSHSTTLTQHATQISSKAESSYVNTIKGTVDTHTTEIAQNATEIASKASQTEVDTVKGTVSNHTSTLSQHAMEISARLTSTQVNSLVDEKGYTTKSYVDNQISATADGIGVELTRVEGKIPTNYTNLNLISGYNKFATGGTNASGLEREITAEGYLKLTRTNNIDGLALFNFQTDTWADMTAYFNSVLNEGDKITVSLLARQTTGTLGNPEIYLSGALPEYYQVLKGGMSRDWSLYRASFTYKQNAYIQPHIRFRYNLGAGSVWEIKSWQVERGDVASPHGPSPRDSLLKNEFTTFKNNYESTVDGITSELSKTAKITDLAGMVTESYLATNQYTKQGEINTQLQSYLKTTDLEGKVQSTSAFQDIKATTDRFTRVIGSTDAQAKTNIAQIAMTDSSFQTSVRDSIKIGGVNLFRNSSYPYDTSKFYPKPTAAWKISDGKVEMGCVYWTGEGTIALPALGIGLEIGETYTLSFYARTNRIGGGKSRSTIYVNPSNRIPGSAVTYTTEWKKYAFTFTMTGNNNDTRIHIYPLVSASETFYISDFKLEKGNVATDWSPAPSDLATSQQLSDVKQTADSIQALVGKTNDSVARAVMTSTLWETEVASEIESALESTTENKTIYPEVAIVSGLDLNLFGRGSGSYRETSQYVEAITTAESLRVYVTIDPDGEDLGGNGTLQVIYGGVSSNVATIYKSLRNYEYFFTLEVPADANRGGSFTFRYVIDGTTYRWGAIKKVAVYRTEVVEEETGTGAIASKISQLSNLISLALTGSEGDLSSLALSARGVSIKGEIINLDGKVKMTEAFAQKLFAEEVSADTVTAFSAKFANAIVGNLDVNNIGGNKASFIQLLLNGTNTALRATSSVVDIMRNDGSISTRLTQNGMEIWRDGSKVGDFESRSSISESGALANKKSISMTPERDSYISLGYYKSGETTSTRVLSVAGDTGRIYIGSALYPSESSTYGLQIQRYTLNSSGGIRVGSTGGSSGIFFGDFGHVSVQFNGTWYSMDRLIN